MSTYTIRYNRTANHIEGLPVVTPDSADGLEYSLSACGALSRGVTRMAKGFSSDDLTETMAHRSRARKNCQNCEKAAQAVLASLV